MITISGFQTQERLYESESTLVYRACRKKDQLPVILKILKNNYPDPQLLALWKNEYQILSSLSSENIIRTYGLEEFENTLVLVLEDSGCQSLNNLLNDKEFSLSLIDSIRLVIKVVDAMSELHEAGIIHKDISSSNIIYNISDGRTKLIDFGISSIHSLEDSEPKNIHALQGTIAYMSPEQTGRTSRTLDMRTDFYSLGVSIYELLCGRLPFISSDSLELVHAHIAERPTPPHQVNTEIPQVLSELVMKLMEKNPEDRYQSASGLREDLLLCEKQLTAFGKINDFTLAEHDVLTTFRVSQKLYGRENEKSELMKSFKRVAEGGHELLMVSGYSGSGKTSLVRELYKPILMKRGIFISGRFDKLYRDVPYRALRNALRELVNFLLAEDEQTLNKWRSKVMNAVGSNGAVLLEISPEFEDIIGPQPEVACLAPAESQNRFNLVLRNFIRGLTKSGMPLVLFFDDLQWADKASLNLLSSLASDNLLRYFFIIGAYRDNEVYGAHQLLQTLDTIQKNGILVENITLTPLSLHDISLLVADSISAKPDELHSFVRILNEKTAGNPFFLRVFLQLLVSENIFKFDKSKSKWCWDKAKLKALDMTDNVADILVDKIQKFDRSVIDILSVASCIGPYFDLSVLHAVCKREPADILEDIKTVSNEGLVVHVEHAIQTNPLWIDEANILNLEFRFLHERIQMVIYSMISDKKQAEYHQEIGQYLWKATPQENFEDVIFDIVNHLNLGRELTTEQFEKETLAAMNLEAAKKAKSSAAWETAYTYTQIGLDILEGGSWQEAYNLSLELHVESAEAAYLCGKYEEMESIICKIFENAETELDRVKGYEIKIQSCKAQYKLIQAVEVALPVLRLLGEKFPDQPNFAHNIIDLTATKILLAGRKIEGLAELPRMQSPEKKAVLRIIANVGSAAYFARPKLMPLLVYDGVKLSIKYGNAPESAFLYAVYGMIHCAVLEDIEQGNKFGQLALDLVERFESLPIKAKTLHMVNVFIRHWKCPLKETLAPLEEGVQSGLETGDFEYAGYCGFFYCFHFFWSGAELNKLDHHIVDYAKVIHRLKHKTSLHAQEILQQTIENLKNSDDGMWLLHGAYFNEEQMLPVLEKAKDQTLLFVYYFTKMFLSYFFGQFHQADSYRIQAEENIEGAMGMIGIGLFNFYSALTSLALMPEMKDSEKKSAIKKILAERKKITKWANHAPETYLQKGYILDAELMRVQGRNTEAGMIYDKAIEFSHKNNNLIDEALANELGAKFYLNLHRPNISRAYMLESRFCYQRWGSDAKVRAIEKECAELLTLNLSLNKESLQTNELPVGTTIHGSSANLDFASIIKASHALSGEIKLTNLLRKMMRIIIENAGAQQAVFVRKVDGKLYVEAEGSYDQERPILIRSVLLENSLVPTTVINYVARTGEYVVLADAVNEGHFANDPYIIAQKTKSILCLPIYHKSELLAIIYLENNLVTGAFTTRCLEILKVLCSQIAISLENATLFAGLTESELRYRELFENIIDMVVLVDKQGRILMGNPLFYSIIERKRDEECTLSFLEFVHPDDHFLVENKIFNRLSTDDVAKDLQFRILSPSKEYQVECSAKSIASSRHPHGFQMVIRDVTERKKLENDLIESLRDAQNARVGTILGLAKLAEYRDEDTGSHLERIREYCRVLVEELAENPDYAGHLTKNYIDDIYLSSILHDIGKVGVPDAVLLKPGRLDDSEFEIIKKHTVFGGNALAAVEAETKGQSFLTLGKSIAYHHHEKWDGSGYPAGLSGTDIPFSARVVALVDVYDALTSKRCYKDAYSHKKALDIIFEGKGSHFAPDIVDAFINIENKILTIHDQLPN